MTVKFMRALLYTTAEYLSFKAYGQPTLIRVDVRTVRQESFSVVNENAYKAMKLISLLALIADHVITHPDRHPLKNPLYPQLARAIKKEMY